MKPLIQPITLLRLLRLQGIDLTKLLQLANLEDKVQMPAIELIPGLSNDEIQKLFDIYEAVNAGIDNARNGIFPDIATT